MRQHTNDGTRQELGGRRALPTETDVAVIGGGIAGLASALTAARAGVRVAVLEGNELGGRGRTTQRDGFALNIGPHAVYDRGALRALISEHALELTGGRPPTRGVGMVRGGERQVVTVSPVGLATSSLLKARSRARVLSLFARVPRMRPEQHVGQSVAEWLGGEPEDVQQFIGAFIRVSTYTHAPAQFDAGAAIAQLQLALHGVTYLDGGWGRMVDVMAARARTLGAQVHDHAAVTSVVDDGARVIVTLGDHEIRARSVVIASGGPDVATRLTGGAVAGREHLTAPIRAASLDLATRRPFPDCFSLGMDRPLYLSPHAPAAKLAPEGRGLVSAMRYLSPDEGAGEPAASRDELRHLARLAGIDDGDVLWERALHQSIVSYGSPTAAGGGLVGRPGTDALGLPRVQLAGDWVGPVGLIGDASAASGVAAGRAAARLCASIDA